MISIQAGSTVFTIGKDNPELLQTMNEGLADLHADPYWKQLLATYNLT